MHSMKTSRRAFLASAAGLAAAAAVPVALAQSRRALRIPRLLGARSNAEPVVLEAQAGRTAFYPGIDSATAGYNGSYLGPTLLFHRGDDVRVNLTNRLAVDTTVHWHGLLVPGDIDGGPHQLVEPGATWRPVLPIRQPGATLFYRSHVHHATAEQVYFGLAGMMIVRDAAEDALGLPSTYGVDDIPVILQDRVFDRGRLVKPAGMMTMMQGTRGNTILVNGTPRTLVGHERPDASRVARTRRFTLDMGMMVARIDEYVRLGDTEVWEVSADTMAHPFHVHGVHFHVLGRGALGPGPDDAGVKDTVRVDKTVRLLARFTQPTNGRPYMYHCHILEHEDIGMMGQFAVA